MKSQNGWYGSGQSDLRKAGEYTDLSQVWSWRHRSGTSPNFSYLLGPGTLCSLAAIVPWYHNWTLLAGDLCLPFHNAPVDRSRIHSGNSFCWHKPRRCRRIHVSASRSRFWRLFAWYRSHFQLLKLLCDVGIKSDAIFNYWPPINLLALVTLVPIRFMLTPRRFHSLNVFCTRTSNFMSTFLLSTDNCVSPGVSAAPILILIALYERRIFRSTIDIPLSAELKVAKGMSRFEVRADVEALINHFVNDEHGTDPEPGTTRPRHLSVNSVMEHGFVQQHEADGNSSNTEWQKGLTERLANIENALLVLSQQGLTDSWFTTYILVGFVASLPRDWDNGGRSEERRVGKECVP